MKKPALEAHMKRCMGVIQDMLTAVRGPRGACRMCDVPSGVQHQESCPTWPVILARSSYRMADEAENPSSERLI